MLNKIYENYNINTKQNNMKKFSHKVTHSFLEDYHIEGSPDVNYESKNSLT